MQTSARRPSAATSKAAARGARCALARQTRGRLQRWPTGVGPSPGRVGRVVRTAASDRDFHSLRSTPTDGAACTAVGALRPSSEFRAPAGRRHQRLGLRLAHAQAGPCLNQFDLGPSSFIAPVPSDEIVAADSQSATTMNKCRTNESHKFASSSRAAPIPSHLTTAMCRRRI